MTNDAQQSHYTGFLHGISSPPVFLTRLESINTEFQLYMHFGDCDENIDLSGPILLLSIAMIDPFQVTQFSCDDLDLLAPAG